MHFILVYTYTCMYDIHVCIHTPRKSVHYHLDWERKLVDYIVAIAPYGGPIGMYLYILHFKCRHCVWL